MHEMNIDLNKTFIGHLKRWVWLAMTVYFHRHSHENVLYLLAVAVWAGWKCGRVKK